VAIPLPLATTVLAYLALPLLFFSIILRRPPRSPLFPYTTLFRSIPTVVFTHRDLEPANEHVSFVSGTPADHRGAIESLADGREVWEMGGGGLEAEVAEAGMVNAVMDTIAPVMLGSGKPLFGGAFDLELQ